MKKQLKKIKFPSELRYDLVGKDWVIIATGRAKRPETFKKEKTGDGEVSKDKCPFCKIETQEPPVLIFNKGKRLSNLKFSGDWTTIVIPNKYPALIPYPNLERRKEGNFFQKMNAVGICEVVVTRDHKKSLSHFNLKEAKELIDVYQERYSVLSKKAFVNYVSIFHNHGSAAGATIAHSHSQIITIPLIDSDLKKVLSNSENYYKKEKKCIYCEMNKWEMKTRKRIVFENKEFLVLCPFASKSAFEVVISPKKHLAYFEKATDEEKWQLAEAFQVALRKIYKGLGGPVYNFYLHTAPSDNRDYSYYHWHWTILPKTSTWAGFELGARMEISTIEPEKAAEYLKKQ